MRAISTGGNWCKEGDSSIRTSISIPAIWTAAIWWHSIFSIEFLAPADNGRVESRREDSRPRGDGCSVFGGVHANRGGLGEGGQEVQPGTGHLGVRLNGPHHS